MTIHQDGFKATLNMTSETVGCDLLQALVQEIKLLPDIWIKLPKMKQDDVIDRLRNRVETNVKMAVHLIASEGRIVVAGGLDQITIKDGVKAVVKFNSAAPNLQELYEASGKSVLVVVANHKEHTIGMSEIQGEFDQRAMDLGCEYDPNSDGEDMGDADINIDDEVINVDVIAIEHKSLAQELQEAWEAGFAAAEAGKPESDCPVMKGELCIEWIKGWKMWHEEKRAGESSDSDLGKEAA